MKTKQINETNETNENKPLIKKKIPILYGIEIEGVFNTNNFKIIREKNKSFLDTEKKNIWVLHNDRSLRNRTNLNAPMLAEFVNIKPLCRKSLIKALIEFKKAFGEKELNESMRFNKSSGCHFHFSKKRLTFSNKTLFSSLEATRIYCLNKINNSNIKKKTEILKHYNREYARLNYRENDISHINLNSRYFEFNFLSEISRKRGMEWRSPNLLYVSNWDDFFKLINIYLDSIEFYISLLEKKQEDFFLISNKAIKDNQEEKLKIDSLNNETIIINRRDF